MKNSYCATKIFATVSLFCTAFILLFNACNMEGNSDKWLPPVNPPEAPASSVSLLWEWNKISQPWASLETNAVFTAVNHPNITVRAYGTTISHENGGIRLGGAGTSSAPRLVIGQRSIGTTTSPGMNLEDLTFFGELNFSSGEFRITIDYEGLVAPAGDSLMNLQLWINNNSGNNVNSPLGKASLVYQLNASELAHSAGRTYTHDSNTSGIPLTLTHSYGIYAGRVVGTFDFAALFNNHESLSNAFIAIQCMLDGKEGGTGNWITITSIKIERIGLVDPPAPSNPTEPGNPTDPAAPTDPVEPEKPNGRSHYAAPPIVPSGPRPWVYFRPDRIPAIKANLQKGQNTGGSNRAWEIHSNNLTRITPALATTNDNYSAEVLSILESRAFDYALNGNEAQGRRAIEEMFDYIRNVRGGDYNKIGHNIYTIGVVYDWCYPLLTMEEKEEFITAILTFAGTLEVGWPPIGRGAVVGHGVEAQLQRDLMVAAIAVYEERPDIYNWVAGRFFEEFVPARRWLSTAHMNMQGDHYTTYRAQWSILANHIFNALGYTDVFGNDYRYTMYWTLYARRPDGQVFRDGDSHRNNLNHGDYNASAFHAMFHFGNHYNDPYLKWEAIQERSPLRPWNPPTSNQNMTAVEMLIFNKPDFAGRAPTDLPLTKYFPYPKGAMIARTGWQTGINSRSVVAEMKINHYWTGNHQHLDAGAFQIYYKGLLASDSGYYQAANYQEGYINDGRTGYDSPHDLNYNKRTIAHNSLLVFDPAELFSWGWANDGGQRLPSNAIAPQTLQELQTRDYKIGEILGREFGGGSNPTGAPNYTYLKGCLEKAYSNKVSGFERSFMFLNLKNSDPSLPEAAVLVFDRVVASNDNFKKTWLLHGLEQPTLNGTPLADAGTRTNASATSNQVQFRNTEHGYNGQLTVDVLLPRPNNAQFTTYSSGTGTMQNFMVNGENYPAEIIPGRVNEGGGWRLELSPIAASHTDYFLNVLQMADAGTTPLPVTMIKTDQVAGAVISNRVVVFGKARDRSNDPVEFSFEGSGNFEIKVADLRPGTWTVFRNGDKLTSVTVSQDGGLAYFTGQSGDYRLQR